jgi:ribA/ribD-fused uncharacterized protein
VEEVSFFRGGYRFLSNFYPAPVEFDGKLYPSVEHAFQAAKTSDPSLRKKIREAKTPGEAKAKGREVPLRKDWESVKLDIMLDLLRRKFGHPHLADLLLETEGLRLVEGNTWNDSFWGVTRGRGKNHLGRLLMKVRDEIRQAKAAK